MQQLLESVRILGTKGPVELVTGLEAERLAQPLSQAFASATPGQDVLLVSSERRIRNVLEPPMEVTVRFDFYKCWLATTVPTGWRLRSLRAWYGRWLLAW